MDKLSLYKLPKDVLVELVCKNFKNMSIEDLGEIYKNKCLSAIGDYKKILNEHHYVDSFHIYHRGNIYIEGKEFAAVINIENNDLCTKGKYYMRTNSEDMLQILRELLSKESCLEKIVVVIEMLIKTYREYMNKKEIIKRNKV